MAFGKKETWKIVYNLPPHKQNAGIRGVALIEAETRSEAVFSFMDQYRGQYHTIDTVEKLFK